MATTASPYGLKPVQMLGGRPYNGGVIREIAMTTNSATAIYAGDVILLGAAAAGQPTAATATLTTSSAGVIGVCVGVSYVDPVLKYQLFAQSLPANAVTAGYTNIKVHVNDDPDQLYKVQAAGSVAATVVGKFAALENFGGNASTGVSTVRLSTPANTGTLAVRIVEIEDAGSAYTDCIVKFNAGVHMYTNATVLAN
ncbi:hypothetical protein [Pseudomonas sp.]|uniref:hypothetical protein n=1 Tax=Pseudomonas sp. TaxID=306 RepID=UPI0025895164|nr:hypothetical protein [Pseudomonas sp.]